MIRIKNLNIDKIEVKTLSELASLDKFTSKDLSIRIEDNLHAKLKKIAYFNDTSMSEILRALLAQFVAQFKPENIEKVDESKEN